MRATRVRRPVLWAGTCGAASGLDPGRPQQEGGKMSGIVLRQLAALPSVRPRLVQAGDLGRMSRGGRAGNLGGVTLGGVSRNRRALRTPGSVTLMPLALARRLAVSRLSLP